MKYIDFKDYKFSAKTAFLVNECKWHLFETTDGFVLHTPNIYHFDKFRQIADTNGKILEKVKFENAPIVDIDLTN